MKKIKLIVTLFLFSFLLAKIDVSASIYERITYAGIEIPSWGGTYTSASKVKTDVSGQVLETIGTYFNRNIQIRFGNFYSPSYSYTGWKSIVIEANKPNTRIFSETQNLISQTEKALVIFDGTKRIQMKTSTSWPDKTSYAGTWWLSETGYNILK